MKKILLFSLLCMVSVISLFAIDTEEVTLVVSGDGATKQEATNVALRSAIEQAYGTFVSANTTILNDALVKDEIATVSSGNIQSFEELTFAQLDNGKSYVTLKVTVSIQKLVQYVRNKGVECEFAGTTFGANRRLYEMNVANTKKVLANTLVRASMYNNLFDYKLKMGEPKADGTIRYKVELYANANFINFYNLIKTTIMGLAKQESEIAYLKNAGYKFYEYRYETDSIGFFFYPLEGFGEKGFNEALFDTLKRKEHNFMLCLEMRGEYYTIDRKDDRDNSPSWFEPNAGWTPTNRRVPFPNYYISESFYNSDYNVRRNGTPPVLIFPTINLYTKIRTFEMTTHLQPEEIEHITKFYLLHKDGSPVNEVPTQEEPIKSENTDRSLQFRDGTTRSLKEQMARSEILKGLTTEEIKALPKEINGIPVCYDDTYDLGIIHPKKGNQVLFYIGKRSDGWQNTRSFGGENPEGKIQLEGIAANEVFLYLHTKELKEDDKYCFLLVKYKEAFVPHNRNFTIPIVIYGEHKGVQLRYVKGQVMSKL